MRWLDLCQKPGQMFFDNTQSKTPLPQQFKNRSIRKIPQYSQSKIQGYFAQNFFPYPVFGRKFRSVHWVPHWQSGHSQLNNNWKTRYTFTWPSLLLTGKIYFSVYASNITDSYCFYFKSAYFSFSFYTAFFSFLKLTFMNKLYPDTAAMQTTASYSPNFPQCVYFSFCLKTRVRVLNFYHFLNHTSSVATIKGVFSKVLHKKQFFSLFSQESNFRGFWLLKENYFQQPKSQNS